MTSAHAAGRHLDWVSTKSCGGAWLDGLVFEQASSSTAFRSTIGAGIILLLFSMNHYVGKIGRRPATLMMKVNAIEAAPR